MKVNLVRDGKDGGRVGEHEIVEANLRFKGLMCELDELSVLIHESIENIVA